MIRRYVLFVLLIFNQYLSAQLPNGSVAPDFDVEDINGNTFSLYAMMGSNKSACIAFEATWCGFCWHFHTSGVLSQVYNTLSAFTTVVMLESDWNTNTDCLYGPSGCNNYTLGDWVTGTPYQIANLSSTNGPTVADDYSRNYYPMLYVISPDKRTWEIIERTYQNYSNWITKSFNLNATASLTHSTCGDDGKIIMNVTGGYSTISYKWSNGATSKDLNNLAGGTYTVTISDANNYFKIFGPYVINGPSKRVNVISSDLTHVKCFNELNGSITVQLDYGTPPYNYNWSNGKKSNFIDNLAANNYFLTVTDNVGCSRVKSYVINQPADLQITAQSSKDNCDNFDGAIRIKPTGGIMPYLYNLGEGNQTSDEFKNLMGGRNYTITVTDINGCTESIKVFVDITHKPKAHAGQDTTIDCLIDFVKLNGTQSDNGPTFSSLWKTQKGNILNGEKTLFPEINLPGWYYHIVTNLNNHCQNLDSIFVNDKRDFPDIRTTGDTSFNCIFKETQVEGNSSRNEVKYFWTKLYDTTFYQIEKVLTAIDSGSYVFNVKDTINLCLIKDTVIIKANYRVPEVSIIPPGNLSCKVSEVILDATNSDTSKRIIYKWSTQDGNIKKGGNTLKPIVDKQGTYILWLQDTTNLCSSEREIKILKQSMPLADFSKIVDGLQLQFTDLSQGIPTSWHWNFGDGATSQSKDPVHLFSKEGEYEVCLIIENDCGRDSICKILQLTKPADLKLTCPSSTTEFSCQTQATINSKFSSWLNSASVTGGCNPGLSNNNSGAPSACGGSTTVKFTATSSCDSTITCSATFTVSPSNFVVITCPVNLTEESCQSQTVIDGKFEAWVASAKVIGGCNSKLSAELAEPPKACGGLTMVKFIVTSTCEAPKTCNAFFQVNPAPPVNLKCPVNQIEDFGQTQAVIDSKFSVWLGSYTLSGGCNSILSNNNSGAPPNTGGVAEVTFTVKSDCEAPVTCKASFTVKEQTATSNFNALKKFELVPNPVNGAGIINLHFDKVRVCELSLKDVFGRTIWSSVSSFKESQTRIELSNLPKGLYYVVLNSDGYRVAKKWIVQ